MADYGQFQDLKAELQERVLTVTLNRPASLNAFGGMMHQELEEFWHLVQMDDAVGAIIITGAGDRAFSAGGDVKRMARDASGQAGSRSMARSFVGAKRLIGGMLEVEQPIIGAINGVAVGLGATIAFTCDIIIASERARFADTHVRVGLVDGDGGCVTWPLMMGLPKAKEHLLTGDWLSAQDAERLGIINYVVPQDQVLPKAREFAVRLANGPIWAIRWTKTTVNKIVRERFNLMMDTGLATEWLTMGSEDHREAVRAWTERREPQFTFR